MSSSSSSSSSTHAATIGSAPPRLSVPIELSNIASSMLQLSQGHEEVQQLPINEGLGFNQQSQQIYRDAIRSVQDQIRRFSRCLAAARHEEQARLVPVAKKPKPSGPTRTCTFSTPHNDNNSPDDISSVHIPPMKKRGILSNPHDDIWSSVPELSKARQMLHEARRVIRLNKKKVAAHKNHPPASMQTRPSTTASTNGLSSGADTVCDDVKKMISVATIGMYQHPLIIPSVPSTLSEPSTSHPFNSSTHYARSNKMSECISAIILYNYALTHHLHAIRTHDLALLAQSADLYDMALQVMHTELDDILKDYTTYNNRQQEDGDDDDIDDDDDDDDDNDDDDDEALGTKIGSNMQDPLLFNLQQVARTAMGAALTNAGLIYHAFNEREDATAVFNVLVQLCDVESRRRNNRRWNHQPDGTAQSNCTNVPSLEATGAIVHDDSTAQIDNGPWDHFFCVAFALRAGTIAPCA